MSKAERFISPREAAAIAGCEPTYIRIAAARGAFASERHEGRVRINLNSFEAWLEGYRVRRHRPVFEGEPTAVGA